jgi:hypothetical protein
MRTMLGIQLCLTVWANSLLAFPVADSQSQLCDAAAQYAAAQTGVPVSILRAVTLAETGRSAKATAPLAPWPWAVHAEGQGHWFPDERSALFYIERKVLEGARNIDIGCFQLNFRWHSGGFHGLDGMIAPTNNALYAARFLKTLFGETGDWRTAVGRYHSRREGQAEKYVERLEMLYSQHIANSAQVPTVPRTAAPVPPERKKYGLVLARSPLLQAPKVPRPLIGGLR